ncbi:MAG: PTS sugar transporter subunit IIC [Candidatus Xenobia bacterium]
MSGPELTLVPGAASSPFLQFLERRVLPPLTKLASQPLVIAVQDGVMTSIPVMAIGFVLSYCFPPDKFLFSRAVHQMRPLVGGIFGAQPPIDGIYRALEAFQAALGCMALWVAFRVAFKLSGMEKRNGWVTGGLSLLAFSFTFPNQGFHNLFLYLARGGLFVAILLAWGMNRLERMLTRWLACEAVVPGAPALLAFGICALSLLLLDRGLEHLSVAIGLQEPLRINTLVYYIFQPLMAVGDSPSVILVMAVMITLTFMGIHGTAVVGSIVLPIYFTLLQDNVAAMKSGQLPPHVVTPMFMHWCFLGGSGGTLMLNLYMLRARSSRLRKLARIALLPSLCNINETLTFGIPLIMNPMMAIPFLLNPPVLAIFHYLVLRFNLVHRTVLYLPFVIPTPISMWLASAGDWRSLLMWLGDCLICGATWWPFFLAYDRKVAADELRAEEAGGVAPL